jgi:hypothetical protein
MQATLACLGFDPAVYRALAEHRKGSALLRSIAHHVRHYEADQFDVAEALYFLACDYGGSEFCPLRRASNATEFRPGMGVLSRNAPEPDSVAAIILADLVFLVDGAP